jgi:hypothetical protein
MTLDLENVYDRLYTYCKDEDFAGYDPFDGLNSSFIRATPLKHLAPARFAWLQLVKRLPMDLRQILRIPKGNNPKGLALFTLAELSRYRADENPHNAGNARMLADRLLSFAIEGKPAEGHGTTAFGYNFDWQSRGFFAPEGTPAIVPTAFASQALVEAYGVLGDEKYLTAADEICLFVLTGLNRSFESDDEICFSYTPFDRSIIYNATLLAGETLARVGQITGNREYLDAAAKTVRFVIRRQRSDGSWYYGEDPKQKWVDNFHTAYVLLSLYRISGVIEELRSETFEPIRGGVNYWLTNFFLEDGTPKYYDNEVYPVDIHAAAVAIASLCELSAIDARMLPMALKTTAWTVENLRDPRGFFYYQKRKTRTIKTPFMRWGQAWMAYALARLMETEKAGLARDQHHGE